MLYLLDANILIDAHRDYYPIHRVPQFWEWLLEQAESDRVNVPTEIYNEVMEGTGALPDWLRENGEAMALDESIDLNLVRQVRARYARDLTVEEIEKIGRDPFLIAYALVDIDRRCIVTTESSRPSRQRANRHIPDVCADLGIRCCDTFQLIRQLDFRAR